MSNILTPKFLPKKMVRTVVDMVLDGFMFDKRMDSILSRKMCHIVVLVPSVTDVHEAGHHPITPFPIFEKSVGKPNEWPRKFDDIARCKAQQLWRGQNTDGNTDSVPHLLFSDNTPFWGGVRRHGIVVACSGVQPYFDQMISGMIADALKAFGRFRFEASDDNAKNRDFLA